MNLSHKQVQKRDAQSFDVELCRDGQVREQVQQLINDILANLSSVTLFSNGSL